MMPNLYSSFSGQKKTALSFDQAVKNQLKPEEEEGVSTSSLIRQAIMQ